MGNITLAIPEELHREMNLHSEIKWSEIARQSFDKKIKELHWIDKVLANSKLTEDDAEKIGHKLKHQMAKRFIKK